MTNGVRQELRAQHTQVLAMHMGYVDTDMTTSFEVAKATPDEVVRQALDALEAGAEEVLADDTAKYVKRGLSAEPGCTCLAPERARFRRDVGSSAAACLNRLL